MAELSESRRFSYQAQHRQSLQPRKSIVSVATTMQPIGHSWMYVLRAMYKQTFSLCTGLGLCTSAIIISSFTDIYDKVKGKEGQHNDPIEVLAIAMYFVGACIGSITCGVYQHTWPARSSNYVIGTILIFSNMLLCMNDVVALAVARLLAGYSFGFIYNIVLMTHIADNVMKIVRGYMATTISIAITLGFAIGVGFSSDLLHSHPERRWIFNVVSIAFPIATIVLTRSLTFEPITWLLKNDLEAEARTILIESRNGLVDDYGAQYEIDEKKHMMLEDYDDQGQRWGFQGVFNIGNIMTLFMILSLRLLNMFTSNIYLYALSAISIQEDRNLGMLISIIVVRLLIIFIPKYSIDKLGRKSLLLPSGLGCCILLVPFAAKHMNYIDIRDDLFIIITFGIHIFAALGIDPIQHIYACEAFSLSNRNGSLAIVTCIEYVLQAIITVCMLLDCKNFLDVGLVASPIAVLLLTIFAFVKLPETKTLALRRCRDQFARQDSNKAPPARPTGIHTLGSTYI